MDEKEMYAALLYRIPTLTTELNIKDATCAYKIAAFFAAFTKKLIRKGDQKAVQACFDAAEFLLLMGKHNVKTAIENVYLFSVSRDIDYNVMLAKQLPPLLKSEYRRQVNSSGI
jgi:hypothetical protein